MGLGNSIALTWRLPWIGLFIVCSGCATHPMTDTNLGQVAECTQQRTVAADAHAQLQSMKSDMASIQIHSAKQAADLQAAQEEVARLRNAQHTLQKRQAEQAMALQEKEATLQSLLHERETFTGAVFLESRPSLKQSHEGSNEISPQDRDPLLKRLDRFEKTLNDLVRHVTTLPSGSKKEVGSFDTGPVSPKEVSRLSEPDPNESRSQSGINEHIWKSSKTSASFLRVTVQPGDTLSRLARSYGSTVSAIQKQNRLLGDLIRIGEELVIPVTSLPHHLTQ